MKIEKEWVKYITEMNIICPKYNDLNLIPN